MQLRKQRFKRPEITNQVVQSVKPKQTNKDAEEARQKLIKFLKIKTNQTKKESTNKADGRKRTHLYYGYSNGKEVEL